MAVNMPQVNVLSRSENIQVPDTFSEQIPNLTSPFKKIPKDMWLGLSPKWL